MHFNELLVFLEQNNLMKMGRKYVDHYKSIIKKCLAPEKEKILIIGDRGYPYKRIAALSALGYYLAAKQMGYKTEIIIQEPKIRGDTADQAVVDALDSLDDENIFILSMSSKLGSIGRLGKNYRAFVKGRQHRFISSTSLGMLENSQYQFLINTINIEYSLLSERCKIIKERLDSGSEIHVETKAGTDFYMNITGKTSIANDGIYHLPGKGGNIPAGETYTPPRGKERIYGRVVIDGSMSYRAGTRIVKDPIILDIEKDKVIDIKGGAEAKLLENTLEWAEKKAKFPWGIRRVGEFGIGLNPHTDIIGATIVDEKTLGTAHIALGSNKWMGGTIAAIIHLDQVFRG